MLCNRNFVKSLGSGLLLVSLWAGYAGVSNAADVSAVDVRETIAQARESFGRASELGFAWSVTPAYIQAAETELAANQLGAAMLAAQRALTTAIGAQTQARTEQGAWQARVPTLKP